MHEPAGKGLPPPTHPPAVWLQPAKGKREEMAQRRRREQEGAAEVEKEQQEQHRRAAQALEQALQVGGCMVQSSPRPHSPHAQPS